MTSGLSKTRLERLHDVLAGYVEAGTTPGIVSLVARRGEAHIETLGTKTIGGEPVRRDTIFRIASMTKPVTAVAAMILAEECVVRLEDPVERWLPELADRRVVKRVDGPIDDTVPADRSITVRDLLNFQMGFGGLFGPPRMYPIVDAANEIGIGMSPPGTPMPKPDEYIRRLGTLPLMHQPGEKWMYNTGSDVLGVLIARASGMSFEDFLRERIFEPLGMKDTSFSVPSGKLDRFTACYSSAGAFDEVDGFWSTPPAFPSGAGGLVSTVDDYYAFGQMMLNGGTLDGERIVSRLSVEAMTTDQLTPEQKAVSGLQPSDFDAMGWGLGLSIITKRDNIASVPGRYGWCGGLGSAWYSDPHEEMVTVILTNKMWDESRPPAVFRDFWTLAYAAIDD